MSRGLAFRRHQYEKRKAKAKKELDMRQRYYDGLISIDNSNEAIGIHAETPKRCSCYMCGNPRKHFDELTLQEKKALVAESEDATDSNSVG